MAKRGGDGSGKRRPVTRRQHVVPKVLLLGFANADGNVQVTHRDGRTHPEAASNASIVKDFYSYLDDSGHRNDTIERWLANHAESPAAGALRAAQRGISPSPVDVPAVARFVAAGLLRTPHVRAIVDAFNNSAVPDMLVAQQLIRAGHDLMSLSPGEREFVVRTARKAWTDGRDSNEELKSVLRTIQRQADLYTAQFQTWTWTVLTAEEPLLVTADVAVATYPQAGTWAGLLPAGHPVYLPVSPRHLLLGEEHSLAPTATDLKVELASVVNQELAKLAHDVVITHPDMPWPANLTLTRKRPAPPSPTITIAATTDEDTFPARYPQVLDPSIRATLDALGAVDAVE